MSDTDLEWLARYTRHDAEDAFAEVVRRHLDLVHSAALRQVRSPQLIEEVAQATFVKLAQCARQLAPDTILTAWLHQVARRESIDVVRRETRRQLREQIATLRDENKRLKRNADELLKLRGEVTRLRRQRDDLLKQIAGKNAPPPGQSQEVDLAWVQQILDGPTKDQGAAAGNLRGKLLRQEMTNISPSEMALRNALLQRHFNQGLERSPGEFADFQSA